MLVEGHVDQMLDFSYLTASFDHQAADYGTLGTVPFYGHSAKSLFAYRSNHFVILSSSLSCRFLGLWQLTIR